MNSSMDSSKSTTIIALVVASKYCQMSALIDESIDETIRMLIGSPIGVLNDSPIGAINILVQFSR